MSLGASSQGTDPPQLGTGEAPVARGGDRPPRTNRLLCRRFQFIIDIINGHTIYMT